MNVGDSGSRQIHLFLRTQGGKSRPAILQDTEDDDPEHGRSAPTYLPGDQRIAMSGT